MLKLNNKGFAVSTILYGILTLTILTLILIFGIMRASKNMNEGLVESLTDFMNKCVSIEVKLENCYLNNGSNCDSIADSYDNCINNKGNTVTPDDDNGSTDEDDTNNTFLNSAILSDNTAYSDASINFAQGASSTNGQGLYYTTTNTLNNQRTYYFRGNVTNNFVKFANYYWRVIRINENGSIRMIYAGTSATSTTDDSIGNSAYNTVAEDNSMVGYMYGFFNAPAYDEIGDTVIYPYPYCVDSEGDFTWADALDELSIQQCQENGNWVEEPDAYYDNMFDSAIKKVIDTWFDRNLSTYELQLDGDAGFCNDRSGTGSGFRKEATNYAFLGRMSPTMVATPKPHFSCLNSSRDLFTSTAGGIGNGELIHPIGLVTADEMVAAGGVYNGISTSYWLYGNHWTMTPGMFLEGTVGPGVMATLNVANDILGEESVWNSRPVRPVINLLATTTLSSTMPSGCTSMTGTASCPYVVN